MARGNEHSESGLSRGFSEFAGTRPPLRGLCAFSVSFVVRDEGKLDHARCALDLPPGAAYHQSVKDWRRLLRADPVDWLLGEDNPSVRYLTLTRILGRPETSREVRQARKRIMESGVVPAILARQEPGGNWGDPKAFYMGKYRSTVWQLIILAELAADPGNPRVKKGCEFILDRAQDRTTGGFAVHTAERTGGGRATEVIPCLTGNMVWSLRRLGYAQDRRVRRGVDWLAEYLRFDDGESRPPADWRYRRKEACYGRHTCFLTVVKGLKALAEVPPPERSGAVSRCIADSVEFMLRHHVYKRSHDLSKVAKPGWRRLGFPRMWQTDILEILMILTRLGVRDARMQEAFDFLVSKQNEHGRWVLQDTFNDRFPVRIEVKGRPSKWVTLNALTVLKNYKPPATA